MSGECDLIVIGAGSAGRSAASLVARLALIETFGTQQAAAVYRIGSPLRGRTGKPATSLARWTR